MKFHIRAFYETFNSLNLRNHFDTVMISNYKDNLIDTATILPYEEAVIWAATLMSLHDSDL